jgi:hypothetical protein
MPRNIISQNDNDPEDMYFLESTEEKSDFIKTYTSSNFYERYPESDYDYDADNYGFYDDYDR